MPGYRIIPDEPGPYDVKQVESPTLDKIPGRRVSLSSHPADILGGLSVLAVAVAAWYGWQLSHDLVEMLGWALGAALAMLLISGLVTCIGQVLAPFRSP